MAGTTGPLRAVRRALVEDPGLTGRAWCRAWCRAVDARLRELLEQAAGEAGVDGVALVAVGGYGRGELAPCSDVDAWLVHRGGGRGRTAASVAEQVWYPLWDEGLKLGHAVRSVGEALDLADEDLETATAVLTARHVAGDPAVTAELAEKAVAAWRRRARRWLPALARSVAERHERAGEVAFLLEPDLKDGRGGLRDVHALGWAAATGDDRFAADLDELAPAAELLLDARVALHRRTGRPSDVLLLEEQDGVAADLGFGDADDLVHALAAAARRIAWVGDEAWRRAARAGNGRFRASRRNRPVAEWLSLRDGEVHLADGADVDADPVLALRAAHIAAANGTVVERASLERLAGAPPLPEPWPPEARERLVQLLLAGPAAIPVVESLDHCGIWTRLLPEWEPTRSRPQRNAYHRFTVDRHLLEAAAVAAGLAGRVARPDLLVLAALLHDIGKAGDGDHVRRGAQLAARIGPRLGLDAADSATLVTLVRHHLLLAETATRRDLDDPATVAAVAAAVGDEATLDLLAALTEADSLATGPAAWGAWKAHLVADLVERVRRVLRGARPTDGAGTFPSARQLALLEAGEQVLHAESDELEVVTADRPGVFAKVAGVLALHGLAVLEAAAHSTERTALARFRVAPALGGGPVRWEPVLADLERAFAGRLAVAARLDERARTYATRRTPSAVPPRTAVSVDHQASAVATVIDVQAPDEVGLLHRITRAMAELDVDIRSAKVSTIGAQAIDAFYVQGRDGRKLTDPELIAELRRAILHAVGTAPGRAAAH